MTDRYYRRGHWVTKSSRKSKKGTSWLLLAIAAGAAWFAVQVAKAEPGAPDQPAPTQQVAPAEGSIP